MEKLSNTDVLQRLCAHGLNQGKYGIYWFIDPKVDLPVMDEEDAEELAMACPWLTADEAAEESGFVLFDERDCDHWQHAIALTVTPYCGGLSKLNTYRGGKTVSLMVCEPGGIPRRVA